MADHLGRKPMQIMVQQAEQPHQTQQCGQTLEGLEEGDGLDGLAEFGLITGVHGVRL